jgi:hypothetical protein
MNRHKVILPIIFSVSLWVVSCFVGASAAPSDEQQNPTSATAQRNAAAAAFEAMLPVLHHPRCMNCHSAGDFPRQGDDSHPHAMNVRRGPEGRGVTSQKCSACHQDHNLAGPHLPPGAPDWQMPPRNTPMIWAGLTDNQLCELLKDPKQNGHRNVNQIVEHMTTPKLVLWGWNPGEGRTPIPVSQADFAAKVKEWAAGGAACPAPSSSAAVHITDR